MFIEVMEARLFSVPASPTGASTTLVIEFELAKAIDVTRFKTAALVARAHGPGQTLAANQEFAVGIWPVWPYDGQPDLLYQRTGAAFSGILSAGLLVYEASRIHHRKPSPAAEFGCRSRRSKESA